MNFRSSPLTYPLFNLETIKIPSDLVKSPTRLRGPVPTIALKCKEPVELQSLRLYSSETNSPVERSFIDIRPIDLYEAFQDH